MSDSNVENTSSDNKNGEETSRSDSKPSLTSVTHKLKTEALRRFKIDDEVENEAESSSNTPDANVDSNIELKRQEANSNLSQLNDVAQGEEREPQRNQESLNLSTSDTFRDGDVKAPSDISVEQKVANLTQSSETQGNQNILVNLEETEATNLGLNDTPQSNNNMIEESISHHPIASTNTVTVQKSSGENDDSRDPAEEFEAAEDAYESVNSLRESSSNKSKGDAAINGEDATQKTGYSAKDDDLSQSSDKAKYYHENKYDTNSSESNVQNDNAELPDQANLIKSSIDDCFGSNATHVKAPDRVIQPLVQTIQDKNVEFSDLTNSKYSSKINDVQVDNSIQLEHAVSNESKNDVKSSVDNVTSSDERHGKITNEKGGLEQNVTVNDGTSNADFKGTRK